MVTAYHGILHKTYDGKAMRSRIHGTCGCFQKLKPDLEPPGRGERAAEDRGERQDPRPSSETLVTACTSFTTSSPVPPPGPAPSPGLATPRRPTSTCTVTNTSDLNDSREINFEYLKHVVLKFMSCREAEVRRCGFGPGQRTVMGLVRGRGP